jgi:HSP20 family protein
VGQFAANLDMLTQFRQWLRSRMFLAINGLMVQIRWHDHCNEIHCRPQRCVGGPAWREPTETARAATSIGSVITPETMTTLTHWNPFRELEDLQNRVLGALHPAKTRNGGEGMSEWSPAVDISEDDTEYLIKAELPEVTRDQVDVSVEDGTIVITGSRVFEKEENNRRYHRVERAYGSFSRSFSLPKDADADKVHADFKDGVLRVHLPKSEQAKPKRIEVKVD